MTPAALTRWAGAMLGLVVLVSGGCAQTAESGKWKSLPLSAVHVTNRVARCLKLEPVKPVIDGAIVKLQVKGTFLRSTAECGCMSALLSYRVYEQRTAEHRDQWVSAVVSTRSATGGATRLFEFVLTSDTAIPYEKGVTLEVGCTPHE